MDEAGLPEESRESMKVLHYFLEGHMSAKAAVGFVAITNHVLDAAKSNRCVTLYREEPDSNELLTIANGVLFDAKNGNDHIVRLIQCDETQVKPNEFTSKLCTSYTQLLHDENHYKWFRLFFGLRDFIYFLRSIRSHSQKDVVMCVSKKQLIHSFERNFNGNDLAKLKDIALHFLGFIISNENLSMLLRHPMNVVHEAIHHNAKSCHHGSKTRFKLIIDETEDDSIMRLLSIEGSLDTSKRCLFQLSNMPEGAVLEQSRLVSGVKYSALQGNTIILSQTESVNESFYDLFNQNFRTLKNREGKISLYANIAVGGISRRSLVLPTFQCIVHVRASELDSVPAPFLNRFEKFHLDVYHVLESGWSRMPGMAKIVQNAKAQVAVLCSLLGENGLFGWIEGQTLDSIFVDMLPRTCTKSHSRIFSQMENDFKSSFSGRLCLFIGQATSLNASMKDLEAVINAARQYLPKPDATELENILESTAKKQANYVDEALRKFANGVDETPLSRILAILVQMYITRIASFRLIMLATPEAVFACR
jgi:hypothetical protein